MTTTRQLSGVLAAIAIGSATACHSAGEPTTERSTTSTVTSRYAVAAYQVPENIRNSTVVWSAEPAIDLHGEQATLVRAAVEADWIALGSPLTKSYPGYERAIDTDSKASYERFGSEAAREFGTAYRHIMRIEPLEDGFVAHTCHQTSNVAVEREPGRYLRRIYGGDFETAITFKRVGTATVPGTPEPTATAEKEESGRPQWQAPTYDLFTGWNIIRGGWSGSEHTQACRQWGRQLVTEAPEQGTIEVWSDTPPETLPAFPGW